MGFDLTQIVVNLVYDININNSVFILINNDNCSIERLGESKAKSKK